MSRQNSVILDVVCGLIFNISGKLLITQRSADGSHPLDWEFPGGKRQTHEKLEDALKRELKEEIDIYPLAVKHFLSHQHQYPEYFVNLHAFIVSDYEGTVKLNENQAAYRWVERDTLTEYRFPKANDIIVQSLLSEMIV